MSEAGNTARALIEWGAERFDDAGLVYAHGTDNALDEAASLVLHSLSIGYDQPDSVLDEPLDASDLDRARELLEQRIKTRRPAAYLLQEAWFAGMPFYIDERVLVPRSPLAELIAASFEPWIDPQRVRHVVDIGTGSGCIAAACAKAFPGAEVDATDVSSAALDVARINVKRHGLEQRVNLVESDLFTALSGRCYDIIVSNPPYVPREEVEQLPEEFRHEPASGLLAGEDGLDIVVRMLSEASGYLAPGGILVVEVGYSCDALQEQYPEVPFVWLEFENGGTGVFLLEAAELAEYQSVFERVARLRCPG